MANNFESHNSPQEPEKKQPSNEDTLVSNLSNELDQYGPDGFELAAMMARIRQSMDSLDLEIMESRAEFNEEDDEY